MHFFHTACIRGVEPRGWKNPYGTIKLIVSSPFFFPPYRVHLYSSHHLQREEWEQKKRRRRRRQRNGPGISGGAVNTHFCASAEASWEKKSKRDKRSRWMAGRSGGVKGERDSARLTKAGGGGGWGCGRGLQDAASDRWRLDKVAARSGEEADMRKQEARPCRPDRASAGPPRSRVRYLRVHHTVAAHLTSPLPPPTPRQTQWCEIIPPATGIWLTSATYI